MGNTVLSYFDAANAAQPETEKHPANYTESQIHFLLFFFALSFVMSTIPEDVIKHGSICDAKDSCLFLNC